MNTVVYINILSRNAALIPPQHKYRNPYYCEKRKDYYYYYIIRVVITTFLVEIDVGRQNWVFSGCLVFPGI